VAEKYPKVKLAYGSLDSADVLEKEAAAADIVIRMLATHEYRGPPSS